MISGFILHAQVVELTWL